MYIPKVLDSGYLASALGPIYIAPANTKALVRQIRFTNVTNVARWITVYQGGPTGFMTSMIAYQQEIPANQSFDWHCYLTVESGYAIDASASTFDAVSYTIMGDEITLG